MNRIICTVGIILFYFVVFAQQRPVSFAATGGVTDIVVSGEYLYAGTNNGKVNVFNLRNGDSKISIILPQIKDFMGEDIPAKIFSIDITDKKEKFLIVGQGKDGFRNLYIHKNGDLSKVIDALADKLMIKKARFVKSDKVLLGLISNEILLLDLTTSSFDYTKQISTSSFSDFVLSEDLMYFITSDESGILRKFETSTGNLIQEFKGENVDNVYQLDFKNNVIIGAGQDRRVSIYQNINSSYYLQSDFLVYSVGLSPSGKIGAYQKNEENEIAIFDIESKNIINTLTGHQTTLTKLLFLSESELISSSDDPEILFWKF